MEAYDIIIIGGGPAGVSAALYAARTSLKVALFTFGGGEITRAPVIENYYGLPSISGAELYETGINQARDVGAEVIASEITALEFEESFIVTAAGGEQYAATACVLAAGKRRETVDVEGISAFEGKGVSYCAVCDGFFYRGRAVAVLGTGDYAASECGNLTGITSSCTLLTNGEDATAELPTGVTVNDKTIAALTGDDAGKLSGATFTDGSHISFAGLFVAVGKATSVNFAAKIGCMMKGDSIAADENGATNVPGLFAAGDCTGGVSQISTAVGEGAVAGLAAVKWVKGKK